MDPVLLSLSIYGAFGLLYGVILQRSGFCFARATYELFLLRSRDALNGVLAGLAVGTIGFVVVVLVRMRLGLPAEDHLLLLPFGAGTLIGAAIFGLGMSLAGMCVVGSLLRLGEGYLAGGLALVGMTVGAAFDPFRILLPSSWSTPLSGASLADWVGLPAGVALTLVAVAAAWWLAGGRGLRLSLAPAVIGGILLALVNTIQMAAYLPWTVAYPLGVVASASEGRLEPTLLSRAMPLFILDVGVVLGALASAIRAQDFRFRWPRQRRQVVLSLAGGLLMGWGVQLARACNIGGIFSALPSLSISAWLFIPALLLGAWLGSLAIRKIG